MKNRFLKLYIVAFFLGSTCMMLAQPGDGNGGTGNDALESTGGDTTPGAPIDDYVWIMAIIGITLVFLKFRVIQKQSYYSLK